MTILYITDYDDTWVTTVEDFCDDNAHDEALCSDVRALEVGGVVSSGGDAQLVFEITRTA